MRGLYKATQGAQKKQAHQDYRMLFALALRHGKQDLVPVHTGGESTKGIDKKASLAIKAILADSPELEPQIAAIYPNYKGMLG